MQVRFDVTSCCYVHKMLGVMVINCKNRLIYIVLNIYFWIISLL